MRKKNSVICFKPTQARLPGVVRLDLSQVPFSYLHIRSQDDQHVLGYGDVDGRFTPVVVYTDRAEADKALKLVEKQLGVSHDIMDCIKHFAAMVLAVITGLVLVISVAAFLQQQQQQSQMISVPAQMAPPQAMQEPVMQAPPAAPTPAPDASGVPVDADSQLR